jgi:streptomycin 6-kinase
VIEVPPALAATHARYFGEAGRAFIAALPTLAETFLSRWELRIDGPARHGVVGLVLPVVRADGTPAALKLCPMDPAHPGEAEALRTWAGDGAVRLLAEDPATWTLLLERLDAGRDLNAVPDDLAATEVIAGLLVRLTAYAAPPSVPRLGDVAARMLADAPATAAALPPAEAAWVRRCAAAVAEVADRPGDRLLHWDLHFDNVLAAEREPWLAIDPKPVAGDPCFELLPALWNRWDEAVATGDPARVVRRRFEVLVDVLGLDRDRAVAWTLGRVLQDTIWSVADGEGGIDDAQLVIAEALTQ